jgi:predicted HTH domain antitoxin
MVFTIPDELFKQARMTEPDILTELACRFFEKRKLTLHDAARLAGLSRAQFENALMDRRIPLFDVTIEDLHHDLENLRRSGV